MNTNFSNFFGRKTSAQVQPEEVIQPEKVEQRVTADVLDVLFNPDLREQVVKNMSMKASLWDYLVDNDTIYKTFVGYHLDHARRQHRESLISAPQIVIKEEIKKVIVEHIDKNQKIYPLTSGQFKLLDDTVEQAFLLYQVRMYGAIYGSL